MFIVSLYESLFLYTSHMHTLCTPVEARTIRMSQEQNNKGEHLPFLTMVAARRTRTCCHREKLMEDSPMAKAIVHLPFFFVLLSATKVAETTRRRFVDSGCCKEDSNPMLSRITDVALDFECCVCECSRAAPGCEQTLRKLE